MAKILVHVTHGSENPTKATLACLVVLIKDSVIDSLTGVGTGNLREHFDSLVKGGARFYVSGMSAKSRGLSDADIAGKPAEFAMPNVLVKLSLEHDRMFNY